MSKEALRNRKPTDQSKLNGVRSVEQPQASKYDAFGQKTGQKASYFTWWMAIDESEGSQRGIPMDYLTVFTSAREGEKIRIIGESAYSHRIINDQLEAKCQPNGTVEVILEDELTPVPLYPNIQVKPGAETIHNYWFVEEDGKNLTLAEAQESGYCNGQNERLLKIHGLLTDNRETNVAITHIVDFAGTGNNGGPYLAVGAGQRYILREPADEPTIQAWQAQNSRAVTA